MTGLREDEWEARMAALSPEAITVAEDVWTEDEPTLAEYELTERILAARAAQTDAATALAELVALKDGPRDADYERRKPLAWEAARAALTSEPQP